MEAESQLPKGREDAISALNEAIEALNPRLHRANRVNIRAGELSFYILSQSSGVPRQFIISK